MPSNAPPSPFPFLPVVLESPTGAQGRAMPAADGTARTPAKGGRRLSRGNVQAPCRNAVGTMQNVPGLSPDDAVAALRVEVVRRLDPAWVTVLGAIVR